MSSLENIPQKPLAQIINEIVLGKNFGEGIEIVPVDNPSIITDLRNTDIRIDFRARENGDENYSSVFEGLAFDPEHVRCQSFALYTDIEGKRTPIGTMSFVITPRKIIEQERYLERKDDGLYLRDFSTLSEAVGEGKELPNFVISPAWTKLDDKFRGKITVAVAGVKIVKEVWNKLKELAPQKTFSQVVAQGKLSPEENGRLKKLTSSYEPDDIIHFSNFPFDIDFVGVNSEGSAVTVNFAEHLGLKKAPNFASVNYLGPVFIGKI
jgi:hypothetical protein